MKYSNVNYCIFNDDDCAGLNKHILNYYYHYYYVIVIFLLIYLDVIYELLHLQIRNKILMQVNNLN